MAAKKRGQLSMNFDSERVSLRRVFAVPILLFFYRFHLVFLHLGERPRCSVPLFVGRFFR
mgnify:CR=1 FL=1